MQSQAIQPIKKSAGGKIKEGKDARENKEAAVSPQQYSSLEAFLLKKNKRKNAAAAIVSKSSQVTPSPRFMIYSAPIKRHSCAKQTVKMRSPLLFDSSSAGEVSEFSCSSKRLTKSEDGVRMQSWQTTNERSHGGDVIENNVENNNMSSKGNESSCSKSIKSNKSTNSSKIIKSIKSNKSKSDKTKLQSNKNSQKSEKKEDEDNKTVQVKVHNRPRSDKRLPNASDGTHSSAITTRERRVTWSDSIVSESDIFEDIAEQFRDISYSDVMLTIEQIMTAFALNEEDFDKINQILRQDCNGFCANMDDVYEDERGSSLINKRKRIERKEG